MELAAPTSAPVLAPPARHPAAQASVGLVTLNARYVHLALALRCLRNAARDAGFAGTWIAEYTIQTPLWKVAAELLARQPEVLGFSIYIWNRRQTLELIERVKKQRPGVRIVVGGPEVSFEAEPPSPYVDVVIAGEGERKWVAFLTAWAEERWAGGQGPDAATLRRWATHGTDLPALERLPYTDEDLPEVAHRLAYIETSRGCPYTCSFCLSALDERVRYFPDEAVREHIQRLVDAGAQRIKFLDRTFNLRKARVREFFTWLAGFEGVEFHFEVVGDLLDEELLALLDEAPPGRFQFEIGIQSAAPETQARVERRQRAPRLFEVIRRLVAADRVHLHLDLIWGLPGEGLAEIRDSFEQVLALRPHELQLGFLKFLPGAPIRRLIGPHGYVFEDGPPYEVLSHRDLPAEAVVELKRFEDVFDRYYNSGRFRFTLERLLAAMPGWDLFRSLAEYFARHDLLVPAHGLEQRAVHLLDWASETRLDVPQGELLDRLRLDWFYHQRVRRAPGVLNPGNTPAPPAVRAYRKSAPDEAVAAFRHEITVEGSRAELRPCAEPVWYAFAYPPQAPGWFFRPRLRRIA